MKRRRLKIFFIVFFIILSFAFISKYKKASLVKAKEDIIFYEQIDVKNADEIKIYKGANEYWYVFASYDIEKHPIDTTNSQKEIDKYLRIVNLSMLIKITLIGFFLISVSKK